ncbi:hypothetical protein ACIQ9K_01830 [Streptomyces microflavus]|uniref:hypothetical protein n=1 Tax=Streptomyces microflavus TaxID=1919 RepID=UPI00381B65F6
MNIGCVEATLLTLTTGSKGAATGELPVTSRKATCWVKQVKAPAGYDLYKPLKSFTVMPGASVAVTDQCQGRHPAEAHADREVDRHPVHSRGQAH